MHFLLKKILLIGIMSLTYTHASIWQQLRDLLLPKNAFQFRRTIKPVDGFYSLFSGKLIIDVQSKKPFTMNKIVVHDYADLQSPEKIQHKKNTFFTFTPEELFVIKAGSIAAIIGVLVYVTYTKLEGFLEKNLDH